MVHNVLIKNENEYMRHRRQRVKHGYVIQAVHLYSLWGVIYGSSSHIKVNENDEKHLGLLQV